MPVRTPFEKFNVFDTELQDALHSRRLSDNLVEIRTPFLRYTTTVEFPTREWYTDLAKTAGAADSFDYIRPFDLNRYDGCKFFTLGIHGLDEAQSAMDSMYGVQERSGLVVGITYSPTTNSQKIVRTIEIGDNNLGERYQSPKSYPPPGVESATVERLRNGNVLKFTVNAVCFTKQQLDMLDILAFSPGMTCILEWGTIISTPTGRQGLDPARILNFSNVSTTEQIIRQRLDEDFGGLRRKTEGTRSNFIKTVCAPNKYHYDYAIAKIANVKTEVSDNKYRITVTAYGVADNIMYISAYATNNPDLGRDETNKSEVTMTSVREYFAPRSKFNYLLNNMVSDPEIVKFDEPDNANEVSGPGAAAGTQTPTNDLGQEQTFYITLNKFINYFINDPENGIAKIINAGTNISDSSNKSIQLLEPITAADGEPLKVGYNEMLRSTDPSSVLIVNKRAMGKSDASKLQADFTLATGGNIQTANSKKPLVNKIETNDFKPIINDGFPSGIASAYTGIWLNSKMIQAVFLEARTIFEGIETMLNKLNAATEGYWDLGLIYDEEVSAFRILDANLKEPPLSPQKIYTFNKHLPNNPSAQGVEGPEVLNIKINMDYPKLLVSQLGISALNSSTGTPDRKDLNFARNPLTGPRLWDMFRKEQPTSAQPNNTKIKQITTVPAKVDEFVKSTLKGALYDDVPSIRTNIANSLRTANFDTLPDNTRKALATIFAIQRPLTESEARQFLAAIQTDELTIQQVNSIKVALGLRSAAIVTRAKNLELTSWVGRGRRIPGIDDVISDASSVNVSAQIEQVKKNIEASRDNLIRIVEQSSQSTIPQTTSRIPTLQGIQLDGLAGTI